MGLPDVIPEDKLPPCWSDEVRMNALFAPFRLKAANPESWEMKMKFWSDMLRLWCQSRGDPVLSAADAKVAFQRKGRTPACIDIVVEEMFRSGELVPIPRYQALLQSEQEGWVRWGARLAFKPAAIALTAVTSLLPARQAVDSDGLPKASVDATQKFVLESVLKEQASSLLSSYPAGESRVGTVDELMQRSGWTRRGAFEMALACLVESGRATVKGDVVKLAEDNNLVSPITETDEALARLSRAEARLVADAARLQRELAGAEGDARAALALGNRTAAKSHLRRKVSSGARLARCLAALDNVRQLLQQLTDHHQTAAILDTYKTAASAMKRDMKENNLSEDAAHDTIDDLKEVMESYAEVSRALAGPVPGAEAGAEGEGEEAALEAELRALLAAGDAESKTPTKAAPTPTPTPTPTPATKAARKISEREFVFDGEERILAELNELGVEDASPPRRGGEGAAGEPLADNWTEVPEKGANRLANKPWYPTAGEWNNNYAEMRTDERLHPGQTLNLDYSRPPQLYAHDFLVRDHRAAQGVWLYSREPADTSSCESPAPAATNFQMAPGGERRRDSLFSAEPAKPAMGNQPTAARNQPSVAGNQSSAIGNQSTRVGNQSTAVGNQSTLAGNQPTVASKQPTIASNQPTMASNQPSMASNQPSMVSNQPTMASNQPTVEKNSPAGDFDDLERRLKNLRGFNL